MALTRYKRTIAKQVNTIAGLKKAIAERDASQQRPVLEARIKELTEAVAERDKAIERLEMANAGLDDRLAEKDNELESLKTQLATVLNEMADNIEDVEQQA
jgi:uncharacterized coiled-coil protein SlyX